MVFTGFSRTLSLLDVYIRWFFFIIRYRVRLSMNLLRVYYVVEKKAAYQAYRWLYYVGDCLCVRVCQLCMRGWMIFNVYVLFVICVSYFSFFSFLSFLSITLIYGIIVVPRMVIIKMYNYMGFHIISIYHIIQISYSSGMHMKWIE